jgi:hypothetical protein
VRVSELSKGFRKLGDKKRIVMDQVKGKPN